VKLQGLKYNFRKVQGVKCKNTVAWEFLEFMKLFSKRKLCGIGSRDRRLGPRAAVHRVYKANK
jgi:hypothetical protein